LAIIGIIAAIMIPSIIANHQKRTLETQFAKTYRTVTHAANMAIAEHGDISTWDWPEKTNDAEFNDAFVKKYFLPYLNILKYCPPDKSTQGCLPDTKYGYANMEGTLSTNYSQNTTRPQVMLADGSSLVFLPYNDSAKKFGEKDFGLDIHFDVNGHKKPNVIGYDMFALSFYPATGEVLPCGVNTRIFDEESGKFVKRTLEEITAVCKGEAKDTRDATWICTAKVVMDGFKINY